jgi:transcriptional regulator with XRE-family HTH domain
MTQSVKLKEAWQAYKAESGSSQAKAAKALGMNQSALSQYLRGEIKTNTDFLTLFDKLTGSDLSKDVSHELKGYAIEIKASLSGLPPATKRVPVESIISAKGCVGVLVDKPCQFEEGSILVADEEAEIREGDLIVLFEKETAIIGNARNSRGVWNIVAATWGETRVKKLRKNARFARITSSFYPPKVGKLLRLY